MNLNHKQKSNIPTLPTFKVEVLDTDGINNRYARLEDLNVCVGYEKLKLIVLAHLRYDKVAEMHSIFPWTKELNVSAQTISRAKAITSNFTRDQFIYWGITQAEMLLPNTRVGADQTIEAEKLRLRNSPAGGTFTKAGLCEHLANLRVIKTVPTPEPSHLSPVPHVPNITTETQVSFDDAVKVEVAKYKERVMNILQQKDAEIERLTKLNKKLDNDLRVSRR
jgi:hypothetical protein